MHKPSSFFTSMSEEQQKLYDEYVTKSKSDVYVGYTPLQCAADDENKDAVKLFLQRATLEELSYKNSADKHPKGTNENILDVAIKNVSVLETA